MTDKTYTSWVEMHRRCGDARRPKYPKYGGRGIVVCSEWHNYENFYADMGSRPEGKTLGRKDNNGNYCKDNCEWQTAQEQAGNKGSYKNNTSGLKGVCYDRAHSKWAAFSPGNTINRDRLYFGRDFFEACCARKSWEVVNG